MSGFKDFDQTTPGNNASIGAVVFTEGQLPSTVNDSNRALMSALRLGLGGAEFSANSATTVDLSQIESNNIAINGTTQVENLGAQSAGIEKTLRFTGALTIKHSAGAITIPGNANFTTGAGDTLKVVSDGSGAWRVTSIEKGVKPAFMAYLDSDITNCTGNASIQGITTFTEDYDIGANFTAGVFTAPVAGMYHLNCHMRFSNLSSATEAYVQIVTSNTRNWRDQDNNVADGSVTRKLSVVTFMTAGGTAQIQGAVSGMAGDTVDILGSSAPGLTWFSGALIA